MQQNAMKNREIVKRHGEQVYQIVCVVLVSLFALMCLYPLLYSLGISLVTQKEWVDSNGLILLFPKNPTLAAYGKVLKTGGFIFKAFGVSLLRTFLGTVGGVLLAAVLGYVLSRKNLPGKGIITGLVLVTIFFSGGMIPTYIVVKELHLINTIWSLILPGLLNTWYALIFKQFFMAIPEEIEEAAQVDGVTELGLFVRIILPMSGPVVASISLFTMVAHWNNWFDAMIYIDTASHDWWPLQYYVTVTFSNMAQLNQGQLAEWENIVGTNSDVADIATKMALTVISLVPILVVYPFFQKHFTKGVYMGAIK